MLRVAGRQQLHTTLLSFCNFERPRNPTSATAKSGAQAPGLPVGSHRTSQEIRVGPESTLFASHHHGDGLGKAEGDNGFRGYRHILVAGKRSARSAGAGSQQAADQSALAPTGESAD